MSWHKEANDIYYTHNITMLENKVVTSTMNG